MTKIINTIKKDVWNKGKKGLQKHSEQQKIKFSKAMKKWWSENKNSEKIKQRNIKIGITNSKSLLGKHCSPRTEFKKGQSPWNKNKKMSEAYCERCKKVNKRLIGWDERLEERRTLIFPLKDTSIEVKIQNFLKELNIEFYTHQYIKDIEHSYQCDILIPLQQGINKKMVIECDGDYWHGNPNSYNKWKDKPYIVRRIELDKIRTREMIERGFKVLRLWESEIKYLDINKFKWMLYNGK